MRENDQICELVTTLQEIAENLLRMSESDAPIQVFCWEDCATIETNEQLLEQTKHSGTDPVEVVELDQFFKPAVTEQDWFGDEEKEIVVRYRSLLSTLKQHLSEIKVYRVREVEIDVYIVGKTQAQSVVGLATQVMET